MRRVFVILIYQIPDFFMLIRSTEDINGLTHKIIGCAMKVYNTLSSGFQEVIYQRSLAIEMKTAGLLFEREKEISIFLS